MQIFLRIMFEILVVLKYAKHFWYVFNIHNSKRNVPIIIFLASYSCCLNFHVIKVYSTEDARNTLQTALYTESILDGLHI